MIPFVLLLIAFIITTSITKLTTGDWNFIFSGNLAMCTMLLFTAIGHFRYTTGMKKMLPSFVPFRKAIVLITGAVEILFGLALVFPVYRNLAGIMLIIFLILVLPANIYAAVYNINYQKGTTDGNGINYLWFRIPLQILFIFWVWYFSIEKRN